MESYYDILKVKPNATLAQIKKSFLSLVSQYHPDIYKGDKIFAQHYTAKLTEAYTTLKDDALRAEYDKSQKINTRTVILAERQDEIWRNTKALRRGERPYVKPKEYSSGKNMTQEEARKSMRNTAMRRTPLLRRIFKSKLFYFLVVIFGLEILILFLFIKP